MKIVSASRRLGASLGLLVLSLAAASAQPSPKAPAAPPPSLAEQCTSDETSSFRRQGKTLRYVFELQNTCEKRLRCTLHIFIVNAYGTNGGEKVMILAPKSKGAASRNSLVLKVKEAGGLTQRTHSCKEI